MPVVPSPVAAGDGVVLAYGPRVAVAASTFSIPAGRMTAVIGPNGSGKSTLLNALAGLLQPVAGRLTVYGGRPGAERGRLAYVMQGTRINEVLPLTVREAVAMGRYARLGYFRWFRAPDRRAVADALETLGLEEVAAAHLTELSGGQRQRVFVAQGLVQEADLVLLDEPLTGLDLVSRDAIQAALRAEIGRGVTVVMTTHDVAEAGAADHVLLMSGRVQRSGPPAEVLQPQHLAAAYELGILHFDGGEVVLDDPHHGGMRRPPVP